MKKFFQKQRELITIFVYIGLIAVLIYFIILPLLSHISTVRDQIQEENIKQELKEKQVNELPKMEDKYRILQNNDEALNVLLDKNDAVPLIEQLEKMAQESGNEILISIQNTENQKNAPVTKNKTKTNASVNQEDEIINNLPSKDYLQMKIILTGDYNAIAKFVYFLENFEYYCDTIAVQVKQKDDSNKNSDIGVRMVVDNHDLSAVKKSEKEIESDNNLEASLDVVFYTKK